MGQSNNKSFFEYAFTKKDIVKYVEDAGFKVIKIVSISPLETLKLEVVGMEALVDMLLRNFLESEGNCEKDNYCRKTKSMWHTTILDLFKKIVRSRIFRDVFAHMILIVAEK